MKKTIAFLILATSFYVLFQACKKTTTVDDGQPNSVYIAAADCTGLTPKYTTDIKPILDVKCATAGCHAAINPAHNLNLSTYATAKSDFNLHALLCSINQDGTCSKMPNNGTKLAATDIKKITCWAKNGFEQ